MGKPCGSRLPNAAELARPTHPRVADVLAKSAVSGATIATVDWASDTADAGAMGAAFLATLRSQGAFDAMLGAMVRLDTRLGGVRLLTTISEGATTSEAAAKPSLR